MFEKGNPPVVAEPPAPEAGSPAGAAGAVEAPAAVEPETVSPVPEGVEAVAEGDGEAAAPAAGETPAAPAEAAAKKGREGARRRGKRGARRPGARAEEYVAPTPEDLAGIASAGVRAAVEAGHPVEGKVIGWNQGGFHVVVDGITAFCPRSSMELGAPHEPAQYLEQVYAFRVLRVEEKGHRLVLSRTAMLREERRHRAEET
jgi:small subunit ribosomal protein S1